MPIAAVSLLALSVAAAAAPARNDGPLPERVTFASADGRTTLTGYVYAPQRTGEGRVPAVVMMHGRAGAYSSGAKGRYDAATLSRRHQMWGRFWAAQGYLAILVDGFGPRGYPQGFPRFSYEDRPVDLDEVTVRPLDAYGALAYLRGRPDVIADRIAVQGWSNGGSATLVTMARDAPGMPAQAGGFRAALVFYPGCGLKHRYDHGVAAYAPVRVFMGTADEEVSPRVCTTLVERSRGQGDIALKLYQGATHSFDDPGANRQSVPANASATRDAMDAAQQFFARELRGGSQ